MWDALVAPESVDPPNLPGTVKELIEKVLLISCQTVLTSAVSMPICAGSLQEPIPFHLKRKKHNVWKYMFVLVTASCVST